MRPGTRAWTCPNCGAEHGAPEIVPAARAHDAGGKGRSRQQNLLPIVAAAGIVLVVIVAFVLTRGAHDATGPTPPPDPVAILCLHLRDLLTPRVDALTRVAQELPADATAIAATGNEQLAANVRQLRTAVIAYRDVLATQADDMQALRGMTAALQKIPC